MKKSGGFECAEWLNPTGRIILVDVHPGTTAEQELRSLETIDNKPFLLLNCFDEPAVFLEAFLQKIVAGETNVLFVFPGNGSWYPWRCSAICHRVRSVKVFAKRFWTPGADPVVTVSQVEMKAFMDLSVRTIVVVDDVISSGQTMRKLHERNSWRFPAARWIGSAWLSRKLSARAGSGIPGYEKVFASFLVPDCDGRKCPINSLSTLIDFPEIAKSYAKRNFKDWKKFVDIISNLVESTLDHHIE